LSLGLARGLNASYSANLRSGNRRDLTGRAENRAYGHSLQLSGSFRPPESWGAQLRSPISLSGRFSMQRDRGCSVRPQTGVPACVPTLDNLSRSLDLTIDTRMDDLDVGFQMSYTSRESFVGLRNGSSSFQLGLFAQFNLAAGAFPLGR
jgi:hypothetical protein